MRTKTYKLKAPIRDRVSTKTLFFTLTSILVLMFVMYAYLVNKTIMNVVSREKTEQKLTTLSSVIGELEFEHMTTKNKVTLDLAYEKGFQDAYQTQFLARGRAPALSYNNR